jgi:hypothetical protein
MKRFFSPILILFLVALAGCSSMSKKDCENADWQAIGYSEGSRGIHYSHLAKHRESCGEYQIIPDDAAYQVGWDQGIRRYCTADNGYRIGSAGQPYKNICPQDAEADFLSGWDQGVRQYCTPDNALRLGLGGHRYNGVCPAGSAGLFQDYYRLGIDVRRARGAHAGVEKQLERVQRSLPAEKDVQNRRKLLHELERLRHEEERSDATVIALEACMNDDWYAAGLRDGEAGQSDRGWEVANVCRNYGIGANQQGYREGWLQGVNYYCSYESGLYVGQSNQTYLGVCSGYGHQQFWRGYEYGRALFRADRYEAHPKPVFPHGVRSAPRQPRVKPMPEHRMPEKRQPSFQQPARRVTPPDRRMQQPVPVQQHRVQPVPASEKHNNKVAQPAVRKAQPLVKKPPTSRVKPQKSATVRAAPAAKQAQPVKPKAEIGKDDQKPELKREERDDNADKARELNRRL